MPRPGDTTQNTKRKCYTRGSEKHIRRICPQNKGEQQQDKSNSQEMEKVNLSNFQGSGLYIASKLNGYGVDYLVDTGAILTVLSTRAWNMIDGQVSSLRRFDKEIVSASGNPLSIKGTTTVTLDKVFMQCDCRGC